MLFSVGRPKLDELSAAQLEDEFDFNFKIRQSSRAKRITLRVCQVTGGLKITIPSNLKISTLRNFIKKNISWIRMNLSKLTPPVFVTDTILLPIGGKNRQLLIDSALRDNYSLTEIELRLPTTKGCFKSQLESVLRQIAISYFRKTCDDYADRLGVAFSKISVRDPKSRWGSCSSDKNLMFSWRLIMAPLEVSSYVAAHEVAHLIHMNHGSNFWKSVESIYPNYSNQRNWLRLNGRNLHKFVF